MLVIFVSSDTPAVTAFTNGVLKCIGYYFTNSGTFKIYGVKSNLKGFRYSICPHAPLFYSHDKLAANESEA